MRYIEMGYYGLGVLWLSIGAGGAVVFVREKDWAIAAYAGITGLVMGCLWLYLALGLSNA